MNSFNSFTVISKCNFPAIIKSSELSFPFCHISTFFLYLYPYLFSFSLFTIIFALFPFYFSSHLAPPPPPPTPAPLFAPTFFLTPSPFPLYLCFSLSMLLVLLLVTARPHSLPPLYCLTVTYNTNSAATLEACVKLVKAQVSY